MTVRSRNSMSSVPMLREYLPCRCLLPASLLTNLGQTPLVGGIDAAVSCAPYHTTRQNRGTYAYVRDAELFRAPVRKTKGRPGHLPGRNETTSHVVVRLSLRSAGSRPAGIRLRGTSWRGLQSDALTSDDSRLNTPETTPPSIPTNLATASL